MGSWFDKCTRKAINVIDRLYSTNKCSRIIVIITTFVFSNSLQYHGTAFASGQNPTTTSNMYSSITNDGLDKSIDSTNVYNMSQIINSSLRQASYATFNNASTPAVGIDPINNSVCCIF